ncbi:hypothetical protein [Candidatus Harpocratesius sp.]
MIFISRIDEVGLAELRNMLKEGKPFNEIMTDVMKIGVELAKKVGHKDYSSFEEFMLEIKEHKSPLYYIDEDVITDFESGGTNLIGVKKCPFKDIMKTMSSSGTADANVDTVMNDHHTREGTNDKFIDLGCYVAQQLRQMIISSLTVNGKYHLNYIHLGCDKCTGKRTINKDDLEAINFDQAKLEKLLEQVDCVYAISYKEGVEE